MYGANSPLANIYKPRNQRGGNGSGLTSLLSLVTSSSKIYFPLLWLQALLEGLEAFVPKRGMLLSGDSTMIPQNWKLRLLPDHSGNLMPLNKQAERWVTLPRVINPDHQRETGLLLPYNKGKDKNSWHMGDPLRILSHPTIKVSGKLQLISGKALIAQTVQEWSCGSLH